MRILVTGGTGQVGRAVVEQAQDAGHEVTAPPHRGPGGCDVADAPAVDALVAAVRPDLVVHAAALTDVDGCEHDPDRAHRVNVGGTAHLAAAATRVGAHVVLLSTDYVYDGDLRRPYVEADPVGPLSVYGATKLAAEGRLGPAATVVRTSWVSSPTGGVVPTVLRLAREQDGPLRFVDDQWGSPTVADDLAVPLLALGLDRRGGIWHVAGRGAATWCDVARRTLAAAALDPDRVEGVATASRPPRPARRPRATVLDTAALEAEGLGLDPWEEAVDRLVARITGAG
ncbi:dTDP-4-dehydrorhamnose reductase [Iamia majanohamensis]|uniref:dTDP-4-dehydrorhamnose reductase n=1 Tax=Iamia majanohamensis TaxID=467976 RepID=A0AAE9Y7H1_9ACTN|nr:dTDP-4-dehydrorhamnose reductase [Iamia majanohamensis]WCO65833.1 dTDP-4-dehydrorhamnose reductase [Iamia majanohamensis]